MKLTTAVALVLLTSFLGSPKPQVVYVQNEKLWNDYRTMNAECKKFADSLTATYYATRPPITSGNAAR